MTWVRSREDHGALFERFILFQTADYYPYGALADVIADFASLGEAEDHLQLLGDDGGLTYVYDSETGTRYYYKKEKKR